MEHCRVLRLIAGLLIFRLQSPYKYVRDVVTSLVSDLIWILHNPKVQNHRKSFRRLHYTFFPLDVTSLMLLLIKLSLSTLLLLLCRMIQPAEKLAEEAWRTGLEGVA